jgi:RNA polymerase sigma-70 factor (ECF subfamily)
LRNAPPKEDLVSNNLNIFQSLAEKDLQEEIEQAIDGLPDRCRLVFILSRFEEMTYQQIADSLDISIKTVENQISKALKTLKTALAAYLPTLLILLLLF